MSLRMIYDGTVNQEWGGIYRSVFVCDECQQVLDNPANSIYCWGEDGHIVVHLHKGICDGKYNPKAIGLIYWDDLRVHARSLHHHAGRKINKLATKIAGSR